MWWSLASPDDPATIVPRPDKQELIAEALLGISSSVIRVVVHGPVGSGKSVLADLTTTTPEIVDRFEVGIFADVHRLPEARGGRRLLVLDNPRAEDVRLAESQLRAGDAVLYAVRHPDALLEGAGRTRTVSVGPLTEGQADRIFESAIPTAGPTDPRWRRIEELTTRLALPLSLCARALRWDGGHPEAWSVWTRAFEATDRSPTGLVRAAVNLGVAHLSASDRSHFRDLSRASHGEPLSPSVAGAIWGVSQIEAARFLSELGSRALVRIRSDGFVAPIDQG